MGNSKMYWPLIGMVAIAAVLLVIAPVLDNLDSEVFILGQISWMESPGLYAGVLLGSIIFPFILSFDKKVHFYTHWPVLWKSLMLPAVVFIVWDMVFTARGIWGFNPQYHYPYTIMGLPIEECLWFFVIPYCCVFIYACLQAYFEIAFSELRLRRLFLILSVAFGLVSLLHMDKMYTMLTFSMAAMFTLYAWRFASVRFLSYFIVTWLVSLIPFLIVNGMLTGMFTQAPVVLYSGEGIMGIRLGSIPLEDAFYLWDYLFIILWGMDLFRKK